MRHTIRLERAAKPKARPRSAAGKRPYMPKPYMDWKEAIAEEAMLRGAVLLDEPARATMTFGRDYTIVDYEPLGYAETSRAGLLTGDVDNYIGGVMDALEGIAWSNDRLLFDVSGRVV